MICMTVYDYSAFSDAWINDLYQSLADMATNYQAINDGIVNGIQTLLDSTAELLTENYMELLLASISSMAKQLEEYQFDSLQPEQYISVPKETLEPLREMTKFVPEEKREEFQEIVSDKESKASKILTVENVKWLLGLIIPMLFSLCLFYLPNKNEEKSLQEDQKQTAIMQEQVDSTDRLADNIGDLIHCIENIGSYIHIQIDIAPNNINEVPNDIEPIPDGIDMID